MKAPSPRTRRALAAQAYSLAGVAAFIGIWAYAASRMEPYVLPAPWAVAARMWELIATGDVLHNFLMSFWRAVLGWMVAVVAGSVIGFLMGRYRYARAFFHDLIYLAANVPLIVYAIVAIVVFGISGMGPTSVVILFVLPSIALNVAAGMMSVDQDLVGMSKAFNRNRFQLFRHVLVPTVTPFAFAGGRVSFADSWKLAALVETFGGDSGVGYQIARSYHLFSVRDLLAWMGFFVIFVVLVERLVLVNVEHRLFRWRNEAPPRQPRFGRRRGTSPEPAPAGNAEMNVELLTGDAARRGVGA
ncbi:ABC transporter permease [Mycobacterium sp. 236(2023)]|uniref:ABC transporter permease n=1 Tax=Mycobacterium sp. 236(2023) TaxID=3038163 RepID=UPI0024153CD0|nr:ABC transporter permease [Mycobacterium sp. 236(2023)]MDG4663767.1 ABC transporter permease [Mycobacterium sp. 236(2023)]